MAADLQKFQYKSKFMRKTNNTFLLVILLNFMCCILVGLVSCSSGNDKDCNPECQHGFCKMGNCECFSGWTGKSCQFCTGRVRLWNSSGLITDGVGNYSEDNQCTWLIAPKKSDSSIRLYLDHFATECSWDHLYIYDGGSIYDPLLAVFSGMVVPNQLQSSRVPEVVAKSGKALLYFYSDAAYNLTGFSISYKIDGCPSSGVKEECSGHGICLEGECTCDAGWIGSACDQSVCPNNCSSHGTCNMERHKCMCHSGYTGSDCGQKEEMGWWQLDSSFNENELASEVELERASHASVVLEDELWVIGGYFFSRKSFVVTKNLTDGLVRPVDTLPSDSPDMRYGHSAVVYNGSIYIYGGIKFDGTESNELWSLDPTKRVWNLVEKLPLHASYRNTNDKESHRHQDPNQVLNRIEGHQESSAFVSSDLDVDGSLSSSSPLQECSSKLCIPVACSGHAMVIVKDMFLLIIFGHSSMYGPLNTVQEYHFKLNRWKLVETSGALVEGVYGHSALWDSETSLVYVYGGLKSATSNSVVADLLTYDPFKNKWLLQTPAPMPRFLHSATLMPGAMLVFGGNTHNDTAFSYGAKCFSADFLLYDIRCNTWHFLTPPPDLGTAIARYGHSTAKSQDGMVIVSGFNGRMLGTILRYHPGKCGIYVTKAKCLTAYPGLKCIWNRVLERCEVLLYQDKTAHDFCPPRAEQQKGLNYTDVCGRLSSCQSCLYNSFGCVWCSHGCAYEKCADYVKGVVSADGCEDRQRWWCKFLKTCDLCNYYRPRCEWINKECTYGNSTSLESPRSTSSTVAPPPAVDTPQDVLGATTVSSNLLGPATNAPHTCPVSCSQRTTCVNCTQGPCMWCFNQQRCVSNNSYLVSFPYGQCMEWTTETRRCPYLEKGLSKCMVHQTCSKCQSDVGCGWCDDGSNTGTGVCLEGGESGPISAESGDFLPRNCAKNQWHFTSCPACNCNGHSHCVNDTCVHPCANNTRGKHCGRCKESFFGRPINGGLCKPCQCNDHGQTCEHDTGVCHCHTKGVAGDHCQRCDTQNNYYGEPLKGSCFYDLQIDYQFTFNLSKQEDVHIRQINFYNIPSKQDVDTDFDIQCSKPARMKLSARQTGGHETWIVKNFTGVSIKRRFSASEYVFGSSENNTTFHVYVFNFTPPIEIVISFSQHPKLDLIQFFSIFSLCFMVLLLMAFVMWKIKQKYDLYTRRQRLMVEMEAMASRPFRSIFLELQLRPSDKVDLLSDSTPEEGLKSPERGKNASTTAINGSRDNVSVSGSSKQDVVVHTTPMLSGAALVVQNVFSKKDKKKKFVHEKTEHHIAVNGGPQKGNSCNGLVHPQMLLHIPNTPLIKKKNNPSPVALEPCGGNMAAVLSMLVQLPTGDSKYTPTGHPGGLAVASALVSLGPPRRTSIETSVPSKESHKGRFTRAKDTTNGARNHDTRM